MKHILVSQTATETIEYSRTFILEVPDDYDTKALERDGLPDEIDPDQLDVEWEQDGSSSIDAENTYVENDPVDPSQLPHYAIVDVTQPREAKE